MDRARVSVKNKQLNKQTKKIHTKKTFHLIATDAVHDDQQQWT